MAGMYWSDTSGLRTLDRALSKLEPLSIRRVSSRALNRVGSMARTKASRELAKHTGLKLKIVRRAMVPVRANATNLQYKVRASGGDVSLKFFAPRETRKGVSANPFRKRQVFDGTFLKGGRFPNRKGIVFHGHVMKRTSADRFPFKAVKSGVVIPNEMIKGTSAQAWESTVALVLPRRLAHELKRETGRAFG